MIADLEAEVERQALLRNHEVIFSVMSYNDIFICSYGKIYSKRLKLDKRLDKLAHNKDYCSITEKEELLEELRKCNAELSCAVQCGSCCFCSPAARRERVKRVKVPKVQTFPRRLKRSRKSLIKYFSEYCREISKENPYFDFTEAEEELNDLLQDAEDAEEDNTIVRINPHTFELEYPMDIDAITARLALSEEKIKSRISAIGFEPT